MLLICLGKSDVIPKHMSPTSFFSVNYRKIYHDFDIFQMRGKKVTQLDYCEYILLINTLFYILLFIN